MMTSTFNIYDPFGVYRFWTKVAEDFIEATTEMYQKTIVLIDTMRERAEYALEEKPVHFNVVRYDQRMIKCGFDLKRPCNYHLVEIIPPEGIEIADDAKICAILAPRTRACGIEGVMPHNEVTEAWAKGYRVYYFMFDKKPVPGQTIPDTMAAIAEYIRDLNNLLPAGETLKIMANCQGAWLLNLVNLKYRDFKVHPVLIAGPLSFHSGTFSDDSMQANGGAIGGTWFASFLSDLFGMLDGANLSHGFNLHSEENFFWSKIKRTFDGIFGKGREKFIEMEKWGSSYCFLNKNEIEWILRELFIGNKLERGELVIDGETMDMRNHSDLLTILTSKGDNIATQWQSLCWIPKVWGSLEELKKAGKRIVVVMHPTAGHLAIFLSEGVAIKYHGAILGSMDNLDSLEPGLYSAVPQEDGTLEVSEMTFEELPQSDPEKEALLARVAKKSEENFSFYDKYVSPIVKMFTPITAPIVKALHPLRMERYPFIGAQFNPFFQVIKWLVPVMKANRVEMKEDNIFRPMIDGVNEVISKSLQLLHDVKWSVTSGTVKSVY